MPYETGEEQRYVGAINIGTVGKPMDGDKRSCYVIMEVDSDASTAQVDSINVEFVRVPCDVEFAARAVKDSPLPNAFGDLLVAAN